MVRERDMLSERLNSLNDVLEECQNFEELAQVEEELDEINETISDSIQNITAEYVQIESEIQEIDVQMEDLCEKLDHWYKYQAVVDKDYSTLDAEYNSLLERKRVLYRIQSENTVQLQGLETQRDSLQRLSNRKEELSEQLQDTAKASGELGRNLKYVGKTIAKNAAKTIAMTPVTLAKSGVKSASHAVENATIGKKVDAHDTSDTGMEAVRLGYGTAKKGYKGIKTVGHTIKTTQRNIKTTKTVAKETAHAVQYTGKMAVKVAVGTVKGATTLITHVIAVVMNPIFWIIAAAFLIFFLITCVLIIIFGSESTRNEALTNAAGLNDVPAQYQEALNYYTIAVQNQRNGFNAIFDGMYYSDTDLKHSNLVYMERTKADDTLTCYQKAFANPTYCGILKNQWEFAVTESEAIAIAYVYLEKIQNVANGTENEIYEITYTQDTFDTIVSKCVAYNDTVFTGQLCPDSRCSRQIIIEENPDYAVALEKNNTAANAYNDWAEVAAALYAHSQIDDGTGQANYWNNVIAPLINTWIVTYNRYPDETNCGYDFLAVLGAEYEAAAAVLNNTPPTIERIIYLCEYLHDLHSVGLYFYDKEDVMNALSFTDAEKQWVELTEIGFDNNPDIP